MSRTLIIRFQETRPEISLGLVISKIEIKQKYSK